jgi:DNA invertase Pin-like site-specific DNA recombinase
VDDDSWHGTVVMHSCDNRLCCNPAHLSLGTQADNIADMVAKGRRVCNPVRGSANHHARLTEEQVIEIHSLLRQGIKRKAIALQFGVSRDLVSQIRAGVRWHHVYVALQNGEQSCQS